MSAVGNTDLATGRFQQLAGDLVDRRQAVSRQPQLAGLFDQSVGLKQPAVLNGLQEVFQPTAELRLEPVSRNPLDGAQTKPEHLERPRPNT